MKQLMVKKRNGKKEKYSIDKVAESITKAANRVKKGKKDKSVIPDYMPHRIAVEIEESLYETDTNKFVYTSDEIATLVENKLMDKRYNDIARLYIQYHYDRQKEHLYNMQIIKSFQKKLKGDDIENSNANVDEFSFSGRLKEASTVFFKDNALHNMSSKTRNNHINNEIYTHDLDSYIIGMHNCLSIPFDELLSKDVYTKQAGIRPPKDIRTACQLIAVIIQIQSLQQFGGVSATHIDWTLIPALRYSFFKHMRNGYKYFGKYVNEDKNSTFKMPKDIRNTSIMNYENDPFFQYAYEMTEKDTHQAIEGLIHNLNSLQSRSGQQLPFSSINYGTCTLKEGQMIIEAILDGTLDGTGPKHETPIFPCGIFQYLPGVNDAPGTPNYKYFQKALVCTAKRFYPNYCNVLWSVNQKGIEYDRNIKRNVISKLSENKYNQLVEWMKKHPQCAKKINLELKGKEIIVSDEVMPTEMNSTMGCRTYSGVDANFTEEYFRTYVIDYIIANGKLPEGELFSANQKDGRGNIAPATIILPTLAMEAKGELGAKDLNSFFNRLDRKIKECRDSLIERFTLIAKQSPKSATFMYNNRTMYGYHPDEHIISALKHGSLAIGQLGLAECLQILIGKDHSTPEGMELAHRIEELFNRRCAEFKKQQYEIHFGEKEDDTTKVATVYLNFGVYYTPAESLCFTALKKFKERYGEIPNVSDKKFFTNSMHIPVWHDITPFEKIDMEAELTGYSNAGCITYVELQPSAYNNPKALEKLVKYAMEKDIPYFALNPVVDSCRDCGFSGEIDKTCPKCGSTDILRLRRVTGYITNSYLEAFNEGKIDEVHHRAKHIGTCDC